jgi:hypothetical protein
LKDYDSIDPERGFKKLKLQDLKNANEVTPFTSKPSSITTPCADPNSHSAKKKHPYKKSITELVPTKGKDV